jgi:hypothetical protein
MTNKKQLLSDIRHISFSEYQSVVSVDERINYLMFMYDPSSEIDDRVLKMVVEVSKVLQDKFGNPNIEVVAYDMSLARLPMKFK